MAEQSTEVRKEDQLLINEFGRLNAKLHEVRRRVCLNRLFFCLYRGSVFVRSATRTARCSKRLWKSSTTRRRSSRWATATMSSASPARGLATDLRRSRARVRRLMLGGEAFVDVEEDFANDYCEKEQEKIQAEMDEYTSAIEKIEARQKELKAARRRLGI